MASHSLILYFLCAILCACQSNPIPQESIDHTISSSNIDILTVARTCEDSKTHLSCPAWLDLYKQMSHDLSTIEVGYEITYKRAQIWLDQILKSLKSNDHQHKMTAYHLLYACLEKLEFRMIEQTERIFEHIERLLIKDQDPLWSIRYLKLLGRFLPVGQVDIIKSYTNSNHQIDIQSAAWQILTQRQALEKTLQRDEIIKASQQEYASSLLFLSRLAICAV